MQLGQTLDGMRVWDVRKAVQALRSVDGFKNVPLWMQGEREMAGITLYASLFEPEIKRLDLWHLNKSHRHGPIFLNVLRYLDVPQAVAMAADLKSIAPHPGARAAYEHEGLFPRYSFRDSLRKWFFRTWPMTLVLVLLAGAYNGLVKLWRDRKNDEFSTHILAIDLGANNPNAKT